jgi:hypothetical protein
VGPVAPGAAEHKAGALVQGAPSATDTGSVFTESLRRVFGESIGRAVCRELKLHGARRAVLESQAVLRALEMAASSQAAYAGLNFASRHAMSARQSSPQFRIVCIALGIQPQALTDETLDSADAGFARRFDEAADGDRHCVDLARSRLLMADALQEAIGPVPRA